MGKRGKISVSKMSTPFFSGSNAAKLDEKNRFVLPQNLRYQLVENGQLEFSIGLSMGGCLAIYKKSDIEMMVEQFKKKQHIAKFQKFFTLFFSTLIQTTCDKVGRVTIPSVLKNGVGIKGEIIIAGALNKIELWPKERYEADLANFVGGEGGEDLQKMMEEAFSTLGEAETVDAEEMIENVQQKSVKL